MTSDAFTIYTSSLVPAPAISPDGGNFAAAQTVTITGIPTGDTCYYTTDGIGSESDRKQQRCPLYRAVHRQPVGEDRGSQLQP